MGEPVRCSHCSDVIGIYEPMIVVDRDGVHRTAIAAHPEEVRRRAVAARYHPACYEQALGAASGGAAA